MSAEITFRKKGNEKQYRFNESLQEQFHVAGMRLEEATSVPSVPPVLRQAQMAMQEGTHLLRLRQKAIRLADCSEFGWSLVAEYDVNKLPDESDDEKKIENAEEAAERKAAMAARKNCGRSVQQQQPGNFVGHETRLLQNPQTGCRI